jgi:hypothetical protein
MNPIRRSGFAMVTAIVLLGLCGMTMTALGVAAHMEATRTQANAEAAQLRQLLSAGAAIAVEKAASNSSGRFDVQLPETLRENSATLSVSIQPGSTDGQRIAEVETGLPHFHISQRLTLTMQSGVWQISGANLGN